MPRLVPNMIRQLDEFPSYKGGHTCIVNDYVFEFAPTHWLANAWGWVAQHRLIGEDIIGRRLVQSNDWDIGEVVHHIDEVKTNNDPSNLEVLTKRAHMKKHAVERAERQKAMLTEEMILEALRCGNLKRAAKSLGCDHNTIRSRFPHLIEAYLRARPHKPSDPATAEKIRPYAIDKTKTMAQAVADLKMSERTILKTCRLHGIAWVDAHRSGRPRKASLPLQARGV